MTGIGPLPAQALGERPHSALAELLDPGLACGLGPRLGPRLVSIAHPSPPHKLAGLAGTLLHHLGIGIIREDKNVGTLLYED